MHDTTPESGCPDCGSGHIQQVNTEFALWRCLDCGFKFSDDDLPSHTTVHRRTRPRRTPSEFDVD